MTAVEQMSPAQRLRFEEHLDLVWRAYLLRKAGVLPIVLVDCGKVYLCASDQDPWGSRILLSHEVFKGVVEAGERFKNRKDVGRADQAEPAKRMTLHELQIAYC